MSLKPQPLGLLLSLLLLWTTACAREPTPANFQAPEQPTLEMSAPTASPSATQMPTATLLPTITPTEPPPPTTIPPTVMPCQSEQCIYASPLFLKRPIAPPGNDVVSATYRFGSTQGKKREPHHGVEFLNGSGTPVLAAADGIVIVAGDDRQPTSPRGAWPITYFGLFSYFYGNLVVIEHPTPAELLRDFPDLPQPFYTLYAHLSQLSVQVGQTVQAGQEVGKVGMSGAAEGSHLHFEVRLGENSYKSVRNPELWLAPRLDQDGQPMGAIAIRLTTPFEVNPQVTGIVLQHLPNGSDQPADEEFYLASYEDKALRGQPPFGEGFALGDLPAGLYRITFAHLGLQRLLVQVYPGQLTLVTLHVE